MLRLKSRKHVREALRPLFKHDDGEGCVIVHAPSCFHCRRALPMFEEAAKSNTQAHRSYTAIDSTDHDLGVLVDEFEVNSVPKFFILRGDYSIEEVYPHRTVQGFLDM